MCTVAQKKSGTLTCHIRFVVVSSVWIPEVLFPKKFLMMFVNWQFKDIVKNVIKDVKNNKLT